MTVKKYTRQNNPFIRNFEHIYKRRGAFVIVDYGNPLSFKYYGAKKPVVTLKQQFDAMKKGQYLEPVYIQKGKCTPHGWYLVAYKATFYAGKPIPVIPKCTLNAFRR